MPAFRYGFPRFPDELSSSLCIMKISKRLLRPFPRFFSSSVWWRKLQNGHFEEPFPGRGKENHRRFINFHICIHDWHFKWEGWKKSKIWTDNGNSRWLASWKRIFRGISIARLTDQRSIIWYICLQEKNNFFFSARIRPKQERCNFT